MVGVLGAISQDDVKRILSFHIVSQIGYMIMGLGLFTIAGIAGAIFYIVHHIVVKTTLFLVGGLVENATGTGALNRLGGLLHRLQTVRGLRGEVGHQPVSENRRRHGAHRQGPGRRAQGRGPSGGGVGAAGAGTWSFVQAAISAIRSATSRPATTITLARSTSRLVVASGVAAASSSACPPWYLRR